MNRARILLAAALAFALVTPALALMIEAPLEELVASSDLVVRGKVASLQSRFLDPATKFIVTDVTLHVDEIWAGDLGDRRTVSFTVVGGVVDGLGMRQSHQPTFAEGEEAVVFLRASTDARLAVNYAEQGKFSVSGDRAISFKQVPVSLQRLRGDVARLKPARNR